jgi:DNA repair protein RecN (Recombination protein N)
MLVDIRVRNYAIIDEVDLELGGGLTVLTGETGAGKSILVDALGLVLGDRADAAAVRHGAGRAEITATFDLEDRPEVAGWLAQNDMDADGECVIRRIISREGRSRAYVNGCALPLQTLRALGEMLVEIHGQHEHQTLTRRPVQRALLDAFGGHEAQADAVRDAHRDREALRERLERLRAAELNRENRLDLLRYQVNELEGLALEPGEVGELETEDRRLQNVERLASSASLAQQLLYEDEEGSAQQRLGRARQEIDSAAELDPGLAGAARLIEEAEIQISEAADDLRRYLADLEMDPERQAFVANRLAAVRDLSRKHEVAPDDLADRLEALREELDELETAGATLSELESALEEATARYRAAAESLHQLRVVAAGKLSEAITAAMHQLGMPGGRFEATVVRDESEQFAAHGIDAVEFLVSANPGQPPAPLARVASGGELSRISLAIQVTTTSNAQCPCLVFDEVDAGVGGGVAEIVGRRLRELGEDSQVVCVTHLPQVASQSHHHIRVAKLTDGKHTRTSLTSLGPDERVEELARMLGGVEITETTRRHAREMIDGARRRGEG